MKKYHQQISSEKYSHVLKQENIDDSSENSIDYSFRSIESSPENDSADEEGLGNKISDLQLKESFFQKSINTINFTKIIYNISKNDIGQIFVEKNFRKMFYNLCIILKILYSYCECPNKKCNKCENCKNPKIFFKKINSNSIIEKYKAPKLQEIKKNIKILKKCKLCCKCTKQKIKITSAKGLVYKEILKKMKNTLEVEEEIKSNKKLHQKNYKRLTKAKIGNYKFMIKYFGVSLEKKRDKKNEKSPYLNFETDLLEKMLKELNEFLFLTNDLKSALKNFESIKSNIQNKIEEMNEALKKILKIENKCKRLEKQENTIKNKIKKLKRIKGTIEILNQWSPNKTLKDIFKMNIINYDVKKTFLKFLKNVEETLEYLKKNRNFVKCNASTFKEFLFQSKFYILHYFTNNNDFLVDFSRNLLKKHNFYLDVFKIEFEKLEKKCEKDLKENLTLNFEGFELNYYLNMLKIFKIDKMKEFIDEICEQNKIKRMKNFMSDSNNYQEKINEMREFMSNRNNYHNKINNMREFINVSNNYQKKIKKMNEFMKKSNYNKYIIKMMRDFMSDSNNFLNKIKKMKKIMGKINNRKKKIKKMKEFIGESISRKNRIKKMKEFMNESKNM